MTRLTWLTAFVLAGATLSSAHAAESAWQERARHRLGGAGGWDLLAVDAASRQVFVTRGDRLMIANVDTGKAIGEVPGLKRAHGVSLVPDLHRGYVSSGGDDRVVAFDIGSLKQLAEIPAGKNPDAMVFDTLSRHLFAFNAGSNDATVIDSATNRVVATVPLPGKPELAVSDGHGKVFVNIEDKNRIAAIDVRSNSVVDTWALGTCEEPTGLALDARRGRLFAVCANRQMAVIDSRSGKLVASVAIGDGPDGAVFDPASRDVFSSNSDGSLTVIHEDDPDHFRVVASVPTPARSRTIALDEKSHNVVLPFAEFGPPPPATSDEPRPRPTMKADSFGLLVVGQR